jgi:hypothetical protein
MPLHGNELKPGRVCSPAMNHEPWHFKSATRNGRPTSRAAAATWPCPRRRRRPRSGGGASRPVAPGVDEVPRFWRGRPPPGMGIAAEVACVEPPAWAGAAGAGEQGQEQEQEGRGEQRQQRGQGEPRRERGASASRGKATGRSRSRGSTGSNSRREPESADHGARRALVRRRVEDEGRHHGRRERRGWAVRNQRPRDAARGVVDSRHGRGAAVGWRRPGT